MCTVSFIASKDKVVITSNRDEHVSRQAKLNPDLEEINGRMVLYPKDKTGGGTWFAVNDLGTAVVLLNGAFSNHKRTPPYRKSRGLIVLEVVAADQPVTALKHIDLAQIEPFTLVVYQLGQLWEFRWDGTQKHLKELDLNKAHIWSSWTLYNTEAQAKRAQYFKEFSLAYPKPTSQEILAFHKENHGDFDDGFVVDRPNGLKTLSITQAVCDVDKISLDHHQLNEGTTETRHIKALVSPVN